MADKVRVTGISFQSTLSVRRATGGLREHHRDAFISIHALRKESDQGLNTGFDNSVISIHALRKESDTVGLGLEIHQVNFNPRSP